MVKVKVVQQDMKRGVHVQTMSAEISWIVEESVLLLLSKEENCDCPLKLFSCLVAPYIRMLRTV